MHGLDVKAPLLGSRSAEQGKPSPWRWWMLLWSALLSCAQGWIWNTFGPISQATERLWGWGDGTIAFMSNWGPIAYMVAFLPTSYLFDVYGLRLATLLSAVLVAVGCGVRLLAWAQATSSPTWILVYMHVGQCLNGLAGPVAMMSGPVVSAAWFPANQRTTSTAIITIFNGLGVAFSNWVGPALVQTHSTQTQQREGMLLYLGGSFIGSCVILFAIALYFPNRPPNAPSITATMERVQFGPGMRQLLGLRNWWLLASSYSVMTGITAAWQSILSVVLKDVVFDSDAVAGNIGLWGGFAGQAAGVGLSLLSDWAGGKKRGILIVLAAVSTVLIVIFALLCLPDGHTSSASGGSEDLLEETGSDGGDASWALYAVSITLNLCQGACFPIFYEMGVEAAFPIAEGLSMGVLTCGMNVFALIFLAIPLVLPMGAWLNWAMVASCAYGLLSIVLFREDYNRTDIDQGRRATPAKTSIQVDS